MDRRVTSWHTRFMEKDRDWVTITIKVGAVFVALLAAFFVLSMAAAVMLGRWDQAGYMLLWVVGAAVVSAMLFGYARKVAR